MPCRARLTRREFIYIGVLGKAEPDHFDHARREKVIMSTLPRRILNTLARILRKLKRAIAPDLDPRRFAIARAYLRLVGAAGRLDFIDDVQGHQMYLDDKDSLGLSVSHITEPTETRLFQRELRPGQTVIDVGANIGYYSLLFARAVGATGRVYAFEPDPTNFAILRQNIDINGYQNITAVRKAAWSSDATLRLYLSAQNRGDHQAYASGEDRPTVEIEAIRLDSFFSTVDRPIDWIKMDIQGAEYHALQGMTQILRRSPCVTLVTEFWPGGLSRASGDPRAYLHSLRELGFTLYHIHDRDDTLSVISDADLLAQHPVESDSFTNLLCRRSPAT